MGARATLGLDAVPIPTWDINANAIALFQVLRQVCKADIAIYVQFRINTPATARLSESSKLVVMAKIDAYLMGKGAH